MANPWCFIWVLGIFIAGSIHPFQDARKTPGTLDTAKPEAPRKYGAQYSMQTSQFFFVLHILCSWLSSNCFVLNQSEFQEFN